MTQVLTNCELLCYDNYNRISELRAGYCAQALLAALLMLGQSSFAATVLYSNLGPNGQYGTGGGYALSGTNFGSQAIGMSFFPNANMNLLDGVLTLGFYRGNNSPINVYLESDASGFPGTILDDLTQMGNIQPLPGGLITFNCTSCPLLQAGKEYWLVAVEPDANSDQTWLFAYQYPTGIYAYNGYGTANGPWSETPGNLSGFRVDGASTVPEPTRTFTFGAGVLALAGVLPRKFADRSPRGRVN